MKNVLKICALSLSMLVAPQMAMSQDGCFADYKAKRSQAGALQLHYGVIQLDQNACQRPNQIGASVSRRISSDGWTLLRIVSTFDQSGLQQRRGNAGQYFLKY
jgi:hypothetical protein